MIFEKTLEELKSQQTKEVEESKKNILDGIKRKDLSIESYAEMLARSLQANTLLMQVMADALNDVLIPLELRGEALAKYLKESYMRKYTQQKQAVEIISDLLGGIEIPHPILGGIRYF